MAFEQITNLAELSQEVDIVKYLASFENIEVPDHAGTTSFNMVCPIPSHTHNDDSTSFVVFPQNNRWQCMASDMKKPASIWDLCQELENLGFRDAVFRVCAVCDVEYLIETETKEAVKSDKRQLALSVPPTPKEIEPEELFERTLNRLQEVSASADSQLCINNWLQSRFNTQEQLDDESILASGVYNILRYDPAHNSVVVLERDETGSIISCRHQKKFVYDADSNALTEQRREGKWFHAAGQPSVPFHLQIFDKNKPILVLEGVTDRIAAHTWQFNYLALNSASTSILNTDERLSSLVGKKLIFYPDMDDAGNALAARLEKQFEKIGLTLRVVNWGDVIDSDWAKQGYDITDFIERVGIESVALLDPDYLRHRRAMRKYAAVSVDPSGPQRDFDQQLASYVNADFVPIKKNAVSMITAPGGTGKSFLVLMMLMRYVIDHQRPVLYVSVEDDIDDITDRIKHIIQTTWDLKDGERDSAEYLVAEYLSIMPRGGGFGVLRDPSKPGYEVDQHKASELKLIMSGIDILVLDPLISFYGGQENSNGDARVFMDTLNALSAQAETSVLVVHHSAKGNDDTTRSRGASAFIDAARLCYTLRRVEISDEEMKLRTATSKGKVDEEIAFDKRRCREVCLTKSNSNVSDVINRRRRRYREVLGELDRPVIRLQLW